MDRGSTGDMAEDAAGEHGIQMEVVKPTESQTRPHAAAAKMGGREKLRLGARFRRLARDYERLAVTIESLPLSCLYLPRVRRAVQNARLL